ncbi:hypothetical protein DRQ33_04000, partial [bacterium]
MGKKKLTMKEQLRLLLRIQEYDSRLLELEMRKSFFPDLLKQLEQEIENLQTEYEQKSARLKEVKKEIGMLELTLKEEEDALQGSQDRLMNVSTNKEYDAVQLEIQSHKEKIADAEEKLIVLLDEQSTLEKDVEQLKEKIGITTKENKSRIEEIKKNSQEINGIIEKIQAERDNLAEKVSTPLINRYRQIRRGRQGVAVVPVVERACGGCRRALP